MLLRIRSNRASHHQQPWLAACAWLLLAGLALAQTAPPKSETSLPQAPEPQRPVVLPATKPCPVRNSSPATATAQAGGAAATLPGANPQTGAQKPTIPCEKPLQPLIDWYARFTDGPTVKPLTPKEKAWLALRNVADPFNGITILGSSAIAVGSNADSVYGPGMMGFERYVGVSYAQNMTGEFIGTFLIPSIVRQDPHYHRMPHAPIQRRIAHAIYQIAWTQGDNGRGMLNYADLVGFAADDEIANLYVPGRETNLTASAARYATGLATAPIDNFVTEFLPDVARHIHVQVVVIQRIINKVARTDTSGQQ
jgi:hypothetical protein